jgi:hypothetical protein
MAYFIFIQYLDSLEDFRKNPHVKIPSKSPRVNFESLCKFKNSIFNLKILLCIHFSLSARLELPAHLAFGPASPASLHSPSGRSLPRRPIWPVCRWRLRRNTFSFLVHAFWAGHILSHLSLSSGAPLNPATLNTLCRPAPCLDWLPRALTCPTIQTSSLTLPLTSPSSMALKTLTPPLAPPARPPLLGAPPMPIKGEHHP